jgi:hypothetical protein
MKTFLPLCVVLQFVVGAAAEQAGPRMVTLLIDPVTTNAEHRVEAFETVRLVSAHYPCCCPHFEIVKGSTVLSFNSDETQGHIYTAVNAAAYQPPKSISVAGPATVRFYSPCPDQSGYVTLELLPQAFPPGQTVLIPPGTNHVAVTLECSTNLVEWASATNGVYGSPIEAKFFRIKAQPAQ